MKKHNLLRKLLAAGISLTVALSCVAMAACGNDDADTGDGQQNDQTDGEETPGTGEEDPGTGDEETPGTGDEETPGTGDEETPGTGDEETPGTGDEETPGTGDEETPGTGDEEDPPAADTSTPLPAENKIYVVGDSTVCSFTDDYYMPRYGYGTQIVEYFNVTSDQVVNLAMSGRSSLSFLTETNYTTLENSIGEGDYLIIGFGHNDEKDDDATRYTNPVPDYQTATGADGAPSFQYTLYENYVKLAKDAGATPILCTPIVRYSSTADYSGSKIHVTEKGDYAAAIKALGEATDTTVIDLTSLTKAVYEADNTAAQYYHAHTTYELDADGITKLPMGRDDTHINKYGAQMVVYQLANALKSTDSTLAAHVKDNIAAPADPSVAVNEGYIKPAYTAPDLSLFTKVTDLAATETTSASSWYRTVVGNIGGTSKYSNYNISYTNNVFTVGVASNNGKFSSDVDGFGTAFMRVDMSTNFTINATATVTNVAAGVANNQSAFGIMLRDDIYRENSGDNYAGKASPNTNYVAAGVFQTGETIFSREKATLTKGDNTGAVATGATYQMTIERVGQVVNVTVVVNGVTKTKTYTDFDFAAVDNEHMYICLFANRGLTVEYSNVAYTYDGQAQGA